tara:strand:- start:159 stop:1178 length:1020 start_codon:yes stop_codon:yes gene_type:complete
MPPKKRTFNDYTKNPNAPTKKNFPKRTRGMSLRDQEIDRDTKRSKGGAIRNAPYTKKDFLRDWVVDQDDPVDVMLTMSGLGWMAKANKLKKRLKKLNISKETFNSQKKLKKTLKKLHKRRVNDWENAGSYEKSILRKPTLEGTARSSPHGKPLSSTDPGDILEELQGRKLTEKNKIEVAKFAKRMDKTIKEQFKGMTDDVDREVKRRHSIEFPEMSPEDWAVLEKEGTRGMAGSKTPFNRHGHGKGIMKKIARATGGTAKDANRLGRKLQKSDERIKRQLKADKKIARKKSQKKILKSKSLQNKMKKAGRKQAGSLKRGLPEVVSPKYDPLKQYSNRQN